MVHLWSSVGRWRYNAKNLCQANGASRKVWSTEVTKCPHLNTDNWLAVNPEPLWWSSVRDFYNIEQQRDKREITAQQYTVQALHIHVHVWFIGLCTCTCTCTCTCSSAVPLMHFQVKFSGLSSCRTTPSSIFPLSPQTVVQLSTRSNTTMDTHWQAITGGHTCTHTSQL